MNLNEYSDQVLPLAAPITPELSDRLFGDDTPYDNVQMLHGIIGVSKEIGELQDNYVRHVFYGKGESLDIPNVLEELGDIMWYLNLIRATAGFTWEQILEANADKLAKKRYKSGSFSKEQALERDLASERAALEQATTSMTSIKEELTEKFKEVRADISKGVIFEHQERNNAARQWIEQQHELKKQHKKERKNPDIVTQDQLNVLLNSPAAYQQRVTTLSPAVVPGQLVGGKPVAVNPTPIPSDKLPELPLAVKDLLSHMSAVEIGNLSHALATLTPSQIEDFISDSSINGTNQSNTTDQT